MIEWMLGAQIQHTLTTYMIANGPLNSTKKIKLYMKDPQQPAVY